MIFKLKLAIKGSWKKQYFAVITQSYLAIELNKYNIFDLHWLSGVFYFQLGMNPGKVF